jgi:hypothetical protein
MRSSEPAISPSSSSRLLATGAVRSPIATRRASSRRRTTSRARPIVPKAAINDPVSAASALAAANTTKSSARSDPRNHHNATAVSDQVSRPGRATWAAKCRPRRPRLRPLPSSASGTPLRFSTSSGGAESVRAGSAEERVWRYFGATPLPSGLGVAVAAAGASSPARASSRPSSSTGDTGVSGRSGGSPSSASGGDASGCGVGTSVAARTIVCAGSSSSGEGTAVDPASTNVARGRGRSGVVWVVWVGSTMSAAPKPASLIGVSFGSGSMSWWVASSEGMPLGDGSASGASASKGAASAGPGSGTSASRGAAASAAASSGATSSGATSGTGAPSAGRGSIAWP